MARAGQRGFTGFAATTAVEALSATVVASVPSRTPGIPFRTAHQGERGVGSVTDWHARLEMLRFLERVQLQQLDQTRRWIRQTEENPTKTPTTVTGADSRDSPEWTLDGGKHAFRAVHRDPGCFAVRSSLAGVAREDQPCASDRRPHPGRSDAVRCLPAGHPSRAAISERLGHTTWREDAGCCDRGRVKVAWVAVAVTTMSIITTIACGWWTAAGSVPG